MGLIPAETLVALRRERLNELALLRRQGRKIVGYFSADFPVELVRAAGAVPVRLGRGGYDAETAGMRFLRADACPFCLSTLGNFALGSADSFYPLVDAVASVNTCDMARRLPESVKHHFGLPVYEVYMPRTAEPLPHRLEEFRRQLEWLGNELAAFAVGSFDANRLGREMAVQNRIRGRLREVDGVRKLDSPTLAETDILDLVMLAETIGPERFLAQSAEWRQSSAATTRPQSGTVPTNSVTSRAGQRPRLMLIGSEVAEKDRWLLRAVEEQADIVTDLVPEGAAWFGEDCPTGEEPLSALSRCYFIRLPGITRRPNDRTYDRIRQLVKEYRVQGVLLKTLLYCDPWNYEAVRLQREIGVPLLHIDGNYSLENQEQVRTRIEAFLESLESSNP